MLTLFKGTYVVWGPAKAPEVHYVAPGLRPMLLDRLIDDNPYVRASAAELVAGKGFTEIADATFEPLMRALGEKYEGPFQREVRATCAGIVLGLTFQQVAERLSGRKGGEGGQRVLAEPRPSKPRPGGAAVAVA